MASLIPEAGPLSRTSLSEGAYQRLLEAIVNGRLASGTELSEVSLAAELGVSRTPVHEALLWLAADGLVEQLPNRKARVAQFSRTEIAEIYEMRLILEPAAAERAARRLEPAALAELRDAAARLDARAESAGWPARALAFDVRFHDEVAAACGNRRLQAEIRKYRHLVRALCRMSGSVANLRAALTEHRRILDAFSARDPNAARRQMALHIEARLENVLADLDGNPRGHAS